MKIKTITLVAIAVVLGGLGSYVALGMAISGAFLPIDLVLQYPKIRFAAALTVLLPSMALFAYSYDCHCRDKPSTLLK